MAALAGNGQPTPQGEANSNKKDAENDVLKELKKMVGKVSTDLEELEQSPEKSYNTQLGYNLKKWVMQFSVSDVTVIHALSKPNRLWIESIKKLVALKLDREPVVVEDSSTFTNIKDLLDCYLSQTKELSMTSK